MNTVLKIFYQVLFEYFLDISLSAIMLTENRLFLTTANQWWCEGITNW